jgi:hypothetical protein
MGDAFLYDEFVAVEPVGLRAGECCDIGGFEPDRLPGMSSTSTSCCAERGALVHLRKLNYPILIAIRCGS